MTPSGIEPATFRLVQLCLNQLRPMYRAAITYNVDAVVITMLIRSYNYINFEVFTVRAVTCIQTSRLEVFVTKGSDPCDVCWCVQCRKVLYAKPNAVCVIMHYAVKTCRGAEVQLHAFLSLAL